MGVHPREAWTQVAEEIAARPDGADAAGDDSRFIALQDKVLVRDVLCRMEVDGRTVLEVGCGPGGKLEAVRKMGRPKRLVGADLTPRMVELSSRRFAGTGITIVQLEPDEPYPFADREFDLVFTCTVLHHNPDEHLPGIVGQITRVAGQEIWLFEAVSDGHEGSGGNFHVRRPAVYRDLLASHGFRLVEQHPVRVSLSKWVADSVQRLAHSRHLRARPYQEGAPLHPLRRAVEQTALPLTSRLDRFVPAKTGLRGMRFLRA